MAKFLLFCWALLLATPLFLQAQPEPCGSDAIMRLAKQADTALQTRQNQAERRMQDFLNNHNRTGENHIITIPTVIHILYNTDEQNLPDSVIYNQMAVLNEDFRRMNEDTTNTPDFFKPIAADMRIEFCLATHDPQGNPTTGITRTYTNVAQFPYNSNNYEVITRMHFDSKGGKNIWNRDEYLNVWVINLDNSSGVLAFAYLPGADPNVDGIVCDYEYFGKPGLAALPYGLGRTMTHEVGHWINLYHPFNSSDGVACSDDFVEDTPPQQEANFNCHTFPYSTCGNVSDIYMNYMDYAGDNCQNMFTQGQANRAHAALHIMRPAILNSSACQPIENNDIKLVAINEPYSSYCFSTFVPIFVSIKNNGLNEVNTVKIGYTLNGQIAPDVLDWTGSLLPGQAADYIFLGVPEMPEGLNELKIYTYLPNNQPDSYPKSDTLTKMVTVGAGIPAPITETFTNPYPQTGWSHYDQANAVPWQQIQEAVCADGSIGGVMAVKNDFSDYFEVEGSIDELYSPNIDLRNFSDAQLQFDVSYRFSNGKADELSVLATTTCSPPYTELYRKSGSTLASRNTPTPQNASHWRTETIDLSAYAGQGVQLVFRNTTAGGNWLMIDNIRITGTQFPVGVQPNLDGSISAALHPNPANNNRFWLHLYNPHAAQPATITVFNLQGQELYGLQTVIASGSSVLPVETTVTASGIYLVRISTPTQNLLMKGFR